MSLIATIFPGGTPEGPEQRAATERQKVGPELAAELLDQAHTHEIYSAASSTFADAVGMMPTPDAVARKFSRGKGYRIYEDMGKNVLFYGALIKGRVNLVMSLKQTWLAGEKGNPQSEAAREAVESAFENIDERRIGLAALAGGIETGFAPAEMVYDVHTRGKANGLVAPVALINRPVDWFRFDWLGRPYFMPEHYIGHGGPISDHKIMWLRYGSLHTPYGRGEGQDCYPAVFAINTVNKFGLDAFERFGYPIAVVTYPRDYSPQQKAELEHNIWKTYKNFLSFPGDVVKPEVTFPAQEKVTTGAFGEAHRAIISKLEYWLSMRLWGAMLSSGDQATGSFARDQVHDAIRLEVAAGDASSIECAVNRSFVRPVMLANFAGLEESLWPRLAIDAQPNADLKQLLDIATAADKLGFPVSRAWFSDTFTLPMAKDDSDELHAPQPAIAAPGDPNAMPGSAVPFMSNALAGAARQMHERSQICVSNADGHVLRFFADEAVLTENRGPVKAVQLTSDDTLIVTRRMLRAA